MKLIIENTKIERVLKSLINLPKSMHQYVVKP